MAFTEFGNPIQRIERARHERREGQPRRAHRRRVRRPGPPRAAHGAHVVVVVQNMSVPQDRRVWQECRALRGAGYRVSVVCPRAVDQPARQTLESIDIHTYVPPPPTRGVISYLVEFVYCWIRTLVITMRLQVTDRIHVIQACNPPDTFFALALLHRPFGTRFVFDQHDLCPEVYASRFGGGAKWCRAGLELLERATYRTADHVIVTNESYRETAFRRGRLQPPSVTVVRSGPDPHTMARGVPRPELRNGRPFLACWLGIMGPQDGVDLLLHSIELFVRDLGREDCHFALMGYGDCLEDLRALSAELHVDPWVTFTGRAGAETIAAYLSTADIGLSADPLNPLNDVSTMNKTMEYMAYEVPVVAYDLKETRVSAGRAALYVVPNDPLAYAKAMSDLLDNADERAAMGAVGRERIEGALAWQRQVPGYVGVFDQLVAPPVHVPVPGHLAGSVAP